jgi:sigma-B regulation protein RsbU (phosphoserine phosphatase)
MAQIEQQLLAALMDTVPDRIYFKDREGRFLLVNKALREYLHLEDETVLVGKTDFDIFLPEHAEEARVDERRILATGEPIIGKLEKETLPGGRITWASTTKVPMRDEAGKIVGICGISRDVTEEHAKTEKLNEYARALAEKQAQMEQELILARQVQLALLPQRYPCFPRGSGDASALNFSFRYLPEGSIGGDFFTVTPVSETKAGVLVCDVMGHGVPAALVTAVQRVLVEELQAHAHDPGAFLGELNRRLFEFFEPLTTSMFVTALYLVVDAGTGRIEFANAGHPPPLHVSRSGPAPRPLGVSAEHPPFALGVASDSSYPTEAASVQAGDLLFLYTDGIFDLGDGRELAADDPQFLALVEQAAGRHDGDFLDAVLAGARKISGVETFLDDVCLLGIEIQRLLGAPAA